MVAEEKIAGYGMSCFLGTLPVLNSKEDLFFLNRCASMSFTLAACSYACAKHSSGNDAPCS